MVSLVLAGVMSFAWWAPREDELRRDERRVRLDDRRPELLEWRAPLSCLPLRVRQDERRLGVRQDDRRLRVGAKSETSIPAGFQWPELAADNSRTQLE